MGEHRVEPEEQVESARRATGAVRQVEYWYQQYVDDFVTEAREQASGAPGRPAPITGPVLAHAHEQAWRHAVVHAQRSANPQDWALMTVAHEAAAYEHLLSWSAATYQVPEEEIRASQTSRGYRHHPR